MRLLLPVTLVREALVAVSVLVLERLVCVREALVPDMDVAVMVLRDLVVVEVKLE